MKRWLVATLTALGLRNCKHQPTQFADSGVSEAWQSFLSGSFSRARELASQRVGVAGDDARFVIVVSAHMLGDHDAVIETRKSINSGYRYLDRLDEPVLWSYAFSDRIREGMTFARARGLLKDDYTRAQADFFLNQPIDLQHGELSTVAFTEDALTPYMPGLKVVLNGQETVARLDTGGSWVVLTESQAKSFGVETLACTKSFFSLSSGKVCIGIGDLEIGNARIRNVPISVVYGATAAQQQVLETNFDVQFGPIIGTNILRHFFTTIDGPGQKIILSNPSSAEQRKAHEALLEPLRQPVEFGIWHSHFIIAQADFGKGRRLPVFLDTGLVVIDDKFGQPQILAPQKTVSNLGILRVKNDFMEVDAQLQIGGGLHETVVAYQITDKQWRGFGDWGECQVTALAGWGYFKKLTWTLDFERQELWVQ